MLVVAADPNMLQQDQHLAVVVAVELVVVILEELAELQTPVAVVVLLDIHRALFILALAVQVS